MISPAIPEVPFTSAEAEKIGISRDRLRKLLAEHQIRKLMRDVYLRADIPDTPTVRAQAAALVVSEHAVICDRTAGWLWEVDTFEYRELEVPAPVETYLLRGKGRVKRRECHGGERDLAPHDICVLHGLKVTTPLRTALDLGCKLGQRDALAALDGFMRRGITRAEMTRALPRYFRRRGVVQLRRLVPLADPRAESPGESWTRLEIIEAGLPWPQLQYWVCEHGRPVFRLDLAYPKSKVAVEYDGREFHDMDDEQREHDEARREWLRQRGWTVIVVTKDDFGPETLTSWLRELRTALRLAP